MPQPMPFLRISKRLAGWTGLEPDSPRLGNYLTACELWSQPVDCITLSNLDRVRSIPHSSSAIDFSRGDILETAKS